MKNGNENAKVKSSDGETAQERKEEHSHLLKRRKTSEREDDASLPSGGHISAVNYSAEPVCTKAATSNTSSTSFRVSTSASTGLQFSAALSIGCERQEGKKSLMVPESRPREVSSKAVSPADAATNHDQVLYAKDLPEIIPPWEHINRLKLQHRQKMDERVIFVDSDHKYYVAWSKEENLTPKDFVFESISVSSFVHDCFPAFNGREVIQKMMASPRWRYSKYYGMSAQEILDSWEANGKMCSSQGSKFHYLLECFYNGMVEPLRSGVYSRFKVIRMFLAWNDQFIVLGKLIGYRAEMQLLEPKLMLTGTIDMLFVEEDHAPPEETDGTLFLHMKDWKFSKGIKLTNLYESGLEGGPTADLPSCNGYMYYLQLNSYKYLIENDEVYSSWQYNGRVYKRVKIASMELVVFHDNQETVQTYPVPDLSSYVTKMAEQRSAFLRAHPSKPQEVADTVPEEHFREHQKLFLG